MRIAFLGTPEIARTALNRLVEAGQEVACVYSQPPAPRGRGQELKPSPTHAFALEQGLPVRTPASMRDPAEIAAFQALGLDAAVVVAFGQILPGEVLDAPRLGSFNLHGSLLPRWRGAAPIQRAVMAGDRETGIMVMNIEEGLDTGPIAMADRIPIGPDTTAGELHDILAQRGAKLMAIAMAALERGTLQLTPQPEAGVTYATKIEKSETRIDWKEPWQKVHDHCRGLSPFPGAWFELADVGRVKVLHTTRGVGSGQPGQALDEQLTIACGDGAVRLVELQRAGRQPMSAEAFLRGTPIPRGTLLG